MVDHDETSGGPSGGIDRDALLDNVTTQVAEQAREHPLRTLGVAFGVGYVLGGGLPRFMVRMASVALLRTAGRAVIAAVPWTRLTEGFDTHGSDEPEPPRRRKARRSSPRRTT